MSYKLTRYNKDTLTVHAGKNVDTTDSTLLWNHQVLSCDTTPYSVESVPSETPDSF